MKGVVLKCEIKKETYEYLKVKSAETGLTIDEVVETIIELHKDSLT